MYYKAFFEDEESACNFLDNITSMGWTATNAGCITQVHDLWDNAQPTTSSKPGHFWNKKSFLKDKIGVDSTPKG